MPTPVLSERRHAERAYHRLPTLAPVATEAAESELVIPGWGELSEGAGSAVVTLLGQLPSLLDSLTDEQYVAAPVGPFGSSIAKHVRHCLDHVAGLLEGFDEGYVDYDRRDRGTAVEYSRHAAMEKISDLQADLLAACSRPASIPLLLNCVINSDGEAVCVATTFGRELTFVMSHTVHHQAMIAAMVKILGGHVPEQFGCAPATIAYLKNKVMSDE